MLPFLGSLGSGFVYDDHLLIERRDAVHALAQIPHLFASEFWQGLAPTHFRYFRPLVTTSFAIDWALYGGRPFGFHLTNLLMHAAVSWLLFAALVRWTSSVWGALVATLAWSWHPSKVEAVSWIAGRTDVLCALGILVMCMGISQRFRGRRVAGVLLEATGLLVALFSKEHAVVAPAFVLIEAWAHRGSGRLDLTNLARAARDAVPHVLVVALYVSARAALMPVVPEEAKSLPFADARLFTIETLGEFGKVVFLPFSFSILRAPILVDAARHVLHDPTRLLSGAAMIVAAAACMLRPGIRGERRAGCLLALLALLPVANLVSARMVLLFAERFAYLPLIGIALALAPLRGDRLAVLAPWAVVLAVSAVESTRHTADFTDDHHLWAHELRENPDQPSALRYACQEAMQKHQPEKAIALAQRGFRAAESWPVSKPDRVEFAARAARSLELLTLDRDRGTLLRIADFYQSLLVTRTRAVLPLAHGALVLDATDDDVSRFLEARDARLATTEVWGALAAVRADRCASAVTLVNDYFAADKDPAEKIEAILVLARCSRWEEASARADELDRDNPAVAELIRNLAWASSASRSNRTGIEGALERSRARTLLLDRGGAYRALEPFRDSILADPEAALVYARVAWAAGEDDDAKLALSLIRDRVDTQAALAEWSRALGRTP